MKSKQITLLNNITVTLFFIIGLIAFFINNYTILTISTSLINLFFIVKFYKKVPILILFLFFFFYTITFNYFFLNQLYISYWTDFQDKTTLKITLFCHLLFLYFLGIFIKSDTKNIFTHDFKHYFKPNFLIFTFLFCVSILILIFGLQGQTLLSGGAYADQELTTKSTMHEYFILIFFFLIVFSPRTNFYKFLLHTLILVYILKTFLYGSRIEVLEISLLWFYLFYVFLNRVNLKFLALIFIFGIYLLTVVSNIRNNPLDFIYGNNFLNFFNPLSIFVNRTNVEIISSNEGDVIQSSARIIGLIEKNELSIYQRVASFLSYLISPLLPSSFLPEYSNLAYYKQDLYKSGGGGLISVYFFTWLGFIGPIFIAIILATFINKFYNKRSIYNYIYTTFLFITFPRWFAYNPIMLVKFCFYAVILYIILNFVKKYMLTNNTIKV
jgi:hypothetical protein